MVQTDMALYGSRSVRSMVKIVASKNHSGISQIAPRFFLGAVYTSNALVSAGVKSNDRSGLERNKRIPVTRSKCTPVSNTA